MGGRLVRLFDAGCDVYLTACRILIRTRDCLTELLGFVHCLQVDDRHDVVAALNFWVRATACL